MKKTCEITYAEIPLGELADTDLVLVNKAVDALSGSHSPYSHFCVGAAVLLENGKILCGSNQENVSFPCTTCAERSALDYARSMFPDVSVDAIAVVARKSGSDSLEDFISPCGLCRQVLVETERRQGAHVRVILAGRQNAVIFDAAKDLLPVAFGF